MDLLVLINAITLTVDFFLLVIDVGLEIPKSPLIHHKWIVSVELWDVEVRIMGYKVGHYGMLSWKLWDALLVTVGGNGMEWIVKSDLNTLQEIA